MKSGSGTLLHSFFHINNPRTYLNSRSQFTNMTGKIPNVLRNSLDCPSGAGKALDESEHMTIH